MHNPSISQMSLRASSPTLTNPDMILPENSPISVPSPTNSRKHQSPPYPPALDNVDHGTPISAPEEKPRMNGAIYSPFRNGVLRPHDGSIRLRSSSEKGKNRVALEDSRPLSRQGPEIPIASSPTLEEDSSQRIYTESTKGDFDNGEGTYTTPAILEEDEGDPHSHAAMTRRAEEILANAKRRLTVNRGVAWVSRMQNLTSSRTWKGISTELEALFRQEHHHRCHRIVLNPFHNTFYAAKADTLPGIHHPNIVRTIYQALTKPIKDIRESSARRQCPRLCRLA